MHTDPVAQNEATPLAWESPWRGAIAEDHDDLAPRSCPKSDMCQSRLSSAAFRWHRSKLGASTGGNLRPAGKSGFSSVRVAESQQVSLTNGKGSGRIGPLEGLWSHLGWVSPFLGLGPSPGLSGRRLLGEHIPGGGTSCRHLPERRQKKRPPQGRPSRSFRIRPRLLGRRGELADLSG